jgi:Domain of unknown function (DUF4396)
MIPGWINVLAIASLLAGLACAAWIAFDEMQHPQHIWIMNLVWPITALYGGVLALWFYYAYGREAAHHRAAKKEDPPFSVMVAKGALHCGSGCTVGDILAEWLAFFVPAVAVWFGYTTLFSEKMFAVWILDFVLAFVFGIAFQYFTIKPMRNLSVRDGLMEALKADTLTVTGWQIGMYGLMAFAQFYVFRPLFGAVAAVNSPEFWFTMQIAMLAGFITSYPVNWWLIKVGIKERM